MGGKACSYTGVHGGERLEPLQLGLYVVMGYLMSVLGTELPLEEEQTFLTAKASLQPLIKVLSVL